jgi:hypothetical protein
MVLVEVKVIRVRDADEMVFVDHQFHPNIFWQLLQFMTQQGLQTNF